MSSPESVMDFLADGVVVVGLLFGVLVLAVAAELLFPTGEPRPDPPGRMRTNVALGTIYFATEALTPVSVLGLAALATARSWGLLPLLGIAGWSAVGLTALIVSAAQYWLHRLSHRVPFLWRIHRVHHADVTLDISTTFRQHPFAGLLSLAYFGALTVVLGLAPLGLLLCGAITLLWSIVQHADIRLPPRLDRLLALVLATPAVHRMHHSARRPETDSNYGEVLTWWDRMFGTWRATDADTQRGMVLGLDDPEHARLSAQLWSPFRR